MCLLRGLKEIYFPGLSALACTRMSTSFNYALTLCGLSHCGGFSYFYWKFTWSLPFQKFLYYFISFFLSMSILHLKLMNSPLTIQTVCKQFPSTALLCHDYWLMRAWRTKQDKQAYKTMDGTRGSAFLFWEKGHRHSDIYFGCSGDVWLQPRFLVVVCSRGCHGAQSGIHNTSDTKSTTWFPSRKFLEVCVRKSGSN